MKKVLREFYGEKAEESKDYCRIGEEGNKICSYLDRSFGPLYPNQMNFI